MRTPRGPNPPSAFVECVEPTKWEGRTPLSSPELKETAERALRELTASGLTQEEALQHIADVASQSALALVERLQLAGPAVVREHRKLDRGFQRRLWTIWGNAFEKCQQVEICCAEIAEEFNSLYRPTAIKDSDFRFEALVRLHARALLVTREVFTLLELGYPSGAWALWRTLHEILVVIKTLSSADVEISERYLCHAAVEEANDLKALHEFSEDLHLDPVSEDELQLAMEAKAEMLNRYGSAFAGDWEWARPLFPEKSAKQRIRFSWLETLAEKTHFRPLFMKSSHRIHAGSMGAHLALTNFRGSQMLITGPTNAGLAGPAYEALMTLEEATEEMITYGRHPEDISLPLVVESLRRLVEDAGKSLKEAEDSVIAIETQYQRAASKGRMRTLLFAQNRRFAGPLRRARRLPRLLKAMRIRRHDLQSWKHRDTSKQ